MNSCAICLEPLSSNSAVGTCVPCGHCFHVECFDGWKAVGISRSNKHPSTCPTCDTKVNHFCRLHLDFNNNDDNVNDDVSEDSGRLKDNYSRTNTQLTEMVEENRKLSSICAKNRIELSECTNLLQEEELCRKSLQRANESLHLEGVRLKNKLLESIQKLADEKDSNYKNNIEFKKLKDSYQRYITKEAQANSLKEVEGILEQNPKILNENSALRNIIRRQKDEIETLQRKSGLKRKF